MDEWGGGAGFEEVVKLNLRAIDVVPRRAARTGLVVRLPGGTIVKESTAAETFAKVVSEFGLERVGKLQKIVNNWPLVSSDKHPNYTQQKVNGYYVMTHNSTGAKKQILEEISQELGIPIEVSISV